jgi:transcriptional regulator with XRE-family HTH domain
MEEALLANYGERIRELRAERGLSLREVEERGGPQKDTLSLIERGEHKPQARTLGKLAPALGMSVADLNAELRKAEETVRPQAPLIREPVERFDRRLREADDADKARELLSQVVTEYDAVKAWHQALKRWGAEPAQLLLAQQDRHAASQRFTAAMLLSAEFVARDDPYRQVPVVPRVAADGVERTSGRVGAEQRRLFDAYQNQEELRRIEEAGQAG